MAKCETREKEELRSLFESVQQLDAKLEESISVGETSLQLDGGIEIGVNDLEVALQLAIRDFEAGVTTYSGNFHDFLGIAQKSEMDFATNTKSEGSAVRLHGNPHEVASIDASHDRSVEYSTIVDERQIPVRTKFTDPVRQSKQFPEFQMQPTNLVQNPCELNSVIVVPQQNFICLDSVESKCCCPRCRVGVRVLRRMR